MHRPRERVFQAGQTACSKALGLQRPMESKGGRGEDDRRPGRQRLENWRLCSDRIHTVDRWLKRGVPSATLGSLQKALTPGPHFRQQGCGT